MSSEIDRPNALPWPPLIYIGAVAAALVLHWLWPLPWIPGVLAELLFAIGWLLIVGALAIDLMAMRTLSRAGTTVRPDRASTQLVTSGPFAVSRNPIYLGNTMLVIGIGLVTAITWFIPLALVAAFITQKVTIEHEERHLEVKFAKRYRDYSRRVRRWI